MKLKVAETISGFVPAREVFMWDPDELVAAHTNARSRRHDMLRAGGCSAAVICDRWRTDCAIRCMM